MENCHVVSHRMPFLVAVYVFLLLLLLLLCLLKTQLWSYICPCNVVQNDCFLPFTRRHPTSPWSFFAKDACQTWMKGEIFTNIRELQAKCRCWCSGYTSVLSRMDACLASGSATTRSLVEGKNRHGWPDTCNMTGRSEDLRGRWEAEEKWIQKKGPYARED